MADFGLAAQIGRGAGGGGAGGIQRIDPANRMAQMLQIQQAQQNMMLQQELAARQRALHPLEMRKLEQTIRTQGYLGDTAGVKAREAGRAENVYTRLLNLRKTTPAETLATPEFRASLATADPELADQLNNIVSGAEKTRRELETAGYNAEAAREARKKAALSAMASTLPGIVDQSTFDTVLAEVEKVDPTTVKLTGRRFTPKAIEVLEKRLRGLSNIEIKQDPDGNWVSIDPDKGTKTVLGPAAAAPAPTPARATPEYYGGVGAAAADLTGAAPPIFTGPAAASMVSPSAMVAPGVIPEFVPRAPASAQPTGAATIIGQRQPPLGPAAAAEAEKTLARKQVEQGVSSEARRRGAAEVLRALSDPALDKLISESTSGYLERAAAGTIGTLTGSATSGMENIGQLETIGSQLVTQILGGKLGGGISNADVQLIRDGMADLANPLKPANQRLAAFKQLRNNLQAIVSGEPIRVAPRAGTKEDVDYNNPLLGGAPK